MYNHILYDGYYKRELLNTDLNITNGQLTSALYNSFVQNVHFPEVIGNKYLFYGNRRKKI